MKAKSNKCEICDLAEAPVLHVHHIIPRHDPRSTEHLNNLVTVCANCHHMIHRTRIICEGWYNTSSGRRFFWRRAGEEPKVAQGVVLYIDGRVEIG
jgi:hypothetical protein